MTKGGQFIGVDLNFIANRTTIQMFC